MGEIVGLDVQRCRIGIRGFLVADGAALSSRGIVRANRLAAELGTPRGLDDYLNVCLSARAIGAPGYPYRQRHQPKAQ
jgi:hypothetical protein